MRIVKLVNPEGLTAAKLFVSNGSLYMVMNEGSVGRVVYRLLVNELSSDELQQQCIDLGALTMWRYLVNDKRQNEMDEISDVAEIQNRFDEWRDIDKDLLAVTYGNGKLSLFDIQ